MGTRAPRLRYLALSMGLWASACSFDFAPFEHAAGSGGEGSASSSTVAVAAATTTHGSSVATTATGSSISSSSAQATSSSSSAGGAGPVGPCSMPTDDFSNASASQGVWHQSGTVDFNGGTANGHIDFFTDSSGFWVNEPGKVALQNCWVSVKVDASALSGSKGYAYVDWREDGSHELRIEVNKDKTVWGHIVDDVLPDLTFGGFAKTHIRFRQEGGNVYVETKEPADTAWVVLGSGPAPTWLTKKEAFGFGVEHPFPEQTSEAASFDDVNLPDLP